MLAGPVRPRVPAAICFVLSPASEARRCIFMRHAVLSLLLTCEPEQGFLESGSCVLFLRSWSFQKPLRRPWFFSLFALYRAGGEPCRSGSVIGASLAASLAPMAQSGGDGRWKHRAQACFLLALL